MKNLSWDDEPPVRLEGYEFEEDLLEHYDFVEILHCIATGELPDSDDAKRRFEALLKVALRAELRPEIRESCCLAQTIGGSPSDAFDTLSLAFECTDEKLVEQIEDAGVKRPKAWRKAIGLLGQFAELREMNTSLAAYPFEDPEFIYVTDKD